MRFDQNYRSADVIDARGGGGGGSRGPGIKLGLGGFLVVGLLSLLFRRNLFEAFDTGAPTPQAQQQQGQQQVPYQGTAEENTQVHFVSFVLDDVQNTWSRLFPALGRPYERAQLVLFTEGVRTGCGTADANAGPFYCPADQRVYLDLGFFQELRARFRAPGDFAQAYVISHEVGHHVQRQLGIEARVHAAQQQDPSRRNVLSVGLELQADCFAGVWAHSTQQRNLLESGDLNEALGAAAAVGDDRIQRSAGRTVNPERWTHGSAEQRAMWFQRGWTSGDPRQCETLSGIGPR